MAYNQNIVDTDIFSHHNENENDTEEKSFDSDFHFPDPAQLISIYIALGIIFVINVVILVNLLMDVRFKSRRKIYILLQIGMVVSDILFSSGSFFMIWFRDKAVADSTLCRFLATAIRFGLLGSAMMVMVLALERYMRVARPLWYMVYYTWRVLALVSGTAVLLTFVGTALTLVHFEHEEPEETETTEKCFVLVHRHNEIDLLVILPVLLILAGVGAMFCNLGVLFSLRKSRQRESSLGSQSCTRHEVAVTYQVLGLAATLTISKVPYALFLTMQYLKVPASRTVIQAMFELLLVGLLLDPLTIFIFTGRYRRRLACTGGRSNESVYRLASVNTKPSISRDAMSRESANPAPQNRGVSLDNQSLRGSAASKTSVHKVDEVLATESQERVSSGEDLTEELHAAMSVTWLQDASRKKSRRLSGLKRRSTSMGSVVGHPVSPKVSEENVTKPDEAS